MSASVREQIISKVVELLSADGHPDGLTVHRERTRPLLAEQLPASVVYCADDEPTPLADQKFAAPLVMRHLRVLVENRAVGSETLSPDEALDPMLIWATQVLVRNERLDGLTLGVEEGRTVWMSREGDQPIAAATMLFTFHYRTRRDDPTSRD
jgi:hypothetical protein